jgi:hypothetical protein
VADVADVTRAGILESHEESELTARRAMDASSGMASMSRADRGGAHL